MLAQRRRSLAGERAASLSVALARRRARSCDRATVLELVRPRSSRVSLDCGYAGPTIAGVEAAGEISLH